MFRHFNLVLAVNHACNLRCLYCYTGEKFSRPMPVDVAERAIDCAIHSLAPGSALELGFFGGEPLLEPELILHSIEYARIVTACAGNSLQLSLTTNGTLAEGDAWRVMLLPDLDLTVSHDGLPAIHDRHRVYSDGRGSASQVEATIRRLLQAGKDFQVLMVVRPDTLEYLPEGITHLRAMGVRRVELSLDLWTEWNDADSPRLERVLGACAELWRAALPDFQLSWFDEKAAGLARVPMTDSARCGFGHQQVAVSPAGNLYPCERLMGADEEHNPMRLPGRVQELENFLAFAAPPARSSPECLECDLQHVCGTTCRCSNYVRTGDISRPDGLLCLVEQLCIRETARVLGSAAHELVTLSTGG